MIATTNYKISFDEKNCYVIIWILYFLKEKEKFFLTKTFPTSIHLFIHLLPLIWSHGAAGLAAYSRHPSPWQRVLSLPPGSKCFPKPREGCWVGPPYGGGSSCEPLALSLEGGHFGHLDPLAHSVSHYPKCMMIAKGQNWDELVNGELCLLAKFPLNPKCLVRFSLLQTACPSHALFYAHLRTRPPNTPMLVAVKYVLNGHVAVLVVAVVRCFENPLGTIWYWWPKQTHQSAEWHRQCWHKWSSVSSFTSQKKQLFVCVLHKSHISQNWCESLCASPVKRNEFALKVSYGFDQIMLESLQRSLLLFCRSVHVFCVEGLRGNRSIPYD